MVSARVLPFMNQALVQKNLGSIDTNLASLVEMRGGASKRRRKNKTSSLTSLDSKKRTASGSTKVGKKTDENPSRVTEAMKKYQGIMPMTRVYISLVALCTFLGLILGDEIGQSVLGLDPIRTLYGFELWRPFTAASFLGKPSIGSLMSGYYLFEYGSSLERVYGTAQQFVFLIGQVVLLSMLSMLFGQPFFGASVITAMLHVLSRSMPHQKVKWLIFTVPYWTLPYGLMASDVLQAAQQGGGAAAALPHILGILSGHFYYFHKFIWPQKGGEDWLAAPDFLVRKLDPNSASLSEGKKSIENALKKRKKGKGRKLSG